MASSCNKYLGLYLLRQLGGGVQRLRLFPQNSIDLVLLNELVILILRITVTNINYSVVYIEFAGDNR
jgi:hypothetical protein